MLDVQRLQVERRAFIEGGGAIRQAQVSLSEGTNAFFERKFEVSNYNGVSRTKRHILPAVCHGTCTNIAPIKQGEIVGMDPGCTVCAG